LLRAVLRDGSIIEERQPHLRRGAHEPLTRADIEEKFAQREAWRRERRAGRQGLEPAAKSFYVPFSLEALRG
jgi:hypothetical protein